MRTDSLRFRPMVNKLEERETPTDLAGTTAAVPLPPGAVPAMSPSAENAIIVDGDVHTPHGG